MPDNKKPGEPVEEERRAQMEKEIRCLKRTTSLLGIGLILQSILNLVNVIEINRIYDMLSTIADILVSITDFHRLTLQILEIFKNLLL